MLELKPKELNLGKYPYTYVRTTVMKSLLFKKADYEKMLKMDFNEIAKFMQDSNYKKEIDEITSISEKKDQIVSFLKSLVQSGELHRQRNNKYILRYKSYKLEWKKTNWGKEMLFRELFPKVDIPEYYLCYINNHDYLINEIIDQMIIEAYNNTNIGKKYILCV